MKVRPHGWEERLEACLQERMNLPFVWGTQDCCMFAADGVRSIMKEDPAESFRGTYNDALSARRVLEAYGGVAAIAAKFAGEEVHPNLAQIGDVGFHLVGTMPSLAIYAGAFWLSPGLECVTHVQGISRVWRCA